MEPDYLCGNVIRRQGKNNVVSNTFVLSALLDSTGLGAVNLNERGIGFKRGCRVCGNG